MLAELSDARTRFTLLEAPPVAGLLELFDAGEHDLLILGSHGRRGVQRMVLGSVAEHVARRALRSVLVVHGAPITEARHE